MGLLLLHSHPFPPGLWGWLLVPKQLLPWGTIAVSCLVSALALGHRAGARSPPAAASTGKGKTWSLSWPCCCFSYK